MYCTIRTRRLWRIQLKRWLAKPALSEPQMPHSANANGFRWWIAKLR